MANDLYFPIVIQWRILAVFQPIGYPRFTEHHVRAVITHELHNILCVKRVAAEKTVIAQLVEVARLRLGRDDLRKFFFDVESIVLN